MSWSSGSCTVGYQVHLNLIDIVDMIADKLPGNYNDFELDTSDLVISMKHHVGYKAWNCNATLESPAEHEVELDEDIDESDVKQAILDALHELKEGAVHPVVFVDDESEWDFPEDYGPDPDRAYDEWRDRQWEELPKQ